MTRAPVQGDRHHGEGTIPWETHLAAYAGYAAAGHGGPYGQSAERIAERGGFSYREAQCAIAGHYDNCGTCTALHPLLDGWARRDARKVTLRVGVPRSMLAQLVAGRVIPVDVPAREQAGTGLQLERVHARIDRSEVVEESPRSYHVLLELALTEVDP